MKRFFLILVVIFLMVPAQAQRGGRRFTPHYGNDADINRTLSFISENLIFDSLTYSRLGNLNGYVRCTFYVDQAGKIVEAKIAKGLAQWLDYEIMLSMNRLPLMTPFKDKLGQNIKVRRDIYFTFNSEDKDSWRNPYEIPDKMAKSIDEQRKDHFDKMAKAENAWSDFVKDNTKISLDGKSVYKPGVLPQNPLKITPPATRPPISITIKSE